jgi:hypothetical protein
MSWRNWQLLARLWSGWLLGALLLATLAPAVSRTLANAATTGGPGWVEICTEQGMQRVHMHDPGSDAGVDAAGTGLLDLCGHCTLAAERFAPLASEGPTLPLIAGSAPTPVLATKSGADAPVQAAKARGPPLPN